MPIAQINVARFRKAKADPANRAFMDALDHVNAQADVADGFIWRLVGEGDANDATAIQAVAGDADFIVNLSVWRDVPSLEAFAYRQADHRAVLARRANGSIPWSLRWRCGRCRKGTPRAWPRRWTSWRSWAAMGRARRCSHSGGGARTASNSAQQTYR
jgi:hypothetical protein